MRINAFCLFLILLLSSCSEKQEFETYISDIGIKFSKPYIIDSISSYGFTDWTLNACIKISDSDKTKILKKWKEKRKAAVSNSLQGFPEKFDKNNSMEVIEIQENFYNYYFRGNHKDRGGYEDYSVSLDTINNKLVFVYGYE